MHCYGEYNQHEKCRTCRERGYCSRTVSDRKLINPVSRAGQYADLIPAPITRTGLPVSGRQYSHEELLFLVNFFIRLNPEDFMILRLRITRREMTVREIANRLLITSKKIYIFFERICAEYPCMKDILYVNKETAK